MPPCRGIRSDPDASPEVLREAVDGAAALAFADQQAALLVDSVAVKGKTQGVKIYELLAMKDTATSDDVELAAAYEAALDAYFDWRWDEAAAILAERPDDGPSKVLLERCRQYAANPPGPDWDGVYVMTTK